MSFAFFDFDKTLLHGDAGPLLGVHLFQRRRQRIDGSNPAGKAAAKKMALWTGLLPYATWMAVQTTLYKARAVRRSTIVRSAYKGFKGVPVTVLDAVLDDFVQAELRPRIYPAMVAEMQAHAGQGRTSVIVTTGMEKLVRRCLPFFPAGTRVIGCEMEERAGRLTGRVVSGPLFGADKANIIRAYCDAAHASAADCHAYSDHYSDHHMLDAVGHGVCINPASRLRRLASRRGWRVLDLPDPRDAAPTQHAAAGA